MRDRRDIRDRREQGGTIRGIARDVGADRNTIRRAIADGSNLDYRRASMADEFEPAVREVLADWPRIPVAQVAELVEWPGSRRALSDLVAKLRPLILERELEDLNRPEQGVARVGQVSTGRLTAGPLIVGRVHGRQEHHPEGSA